MSWECSRMDGISLDDIAFWSLYLLGSAFSMRRECFRALGICRFDHSLFGKVLETFEHFRNCWEFFFRPAPLWLPPGRRTLLCWLNELRKCMHYIPLWGFESGAKSYHIMPVPKRRPPETQQNHNNRNHKFSELLRSISNTFKPFGDDLTLQSSNTGAQDYFVQLYQCTRS